MIKELVAPKDLTILNVFYSSNRWILEAKTDKTEKRNRKIGVALNLNSMKAEICIYVIHYHTSMPIKNALHILGSW